MKIRPHSSLLNVAGCFI